MEQFILTFSDYVDNYASDLKPITFWCRNGFWIFDAGSWLWTWHEHVL